MEKIKPLVSVMMNCFNADTYLKQAIDSVYSQSFQDWEIIFWDNASTDNSLGIAEAYDERLKIFKSSETVNLGKARSEAVQKAEGKYLAFLDCDDMWLKNNLENQVNIFLSDRNDIGLVYGRSRIINAENIEIGFYPNIDKELPEGHIFEELCKQNFIPFVSAMADKEKYYSAGGFPRDFKHSTDYYLFLNIARKYKVSPTESINSCYRIHGSNLTASSQSIAANESIKVVSSFLPNKSAHIGLKYQTLNLSIAYFKENKIIKSFLTIIKNNLWILAFKRLLRLFFK